MLRDCLTRVLITPRLDGLLLLGKQAKPETGGGSGEHPSAPLSCVCAANINFGARLAASRGAHDRPDDWERARSLSDAQISPY